jgi:hypothetical protein
MFGMSVTVDLARNETFLYATEERGRIFGYAVAPNGALSMLPGSPVTHGEFVYNYDAQYDPQRNVLLQFDANASRAHVWAVSTTGGLTQLAGSPFSTMQRGGSRFNRAGTWFYMTSVGQGGLQRYTLDAIGAPLPAQYANGFPSGFTSELEFAVDDRFIFVLSRTDGSNGPGRIDTFSLDGFGTATKVGTAETLFPSTSNTNACSMVVTP